MAFQVTINGTDYTDYVEWSTLAATEAHAIRGSTLTCEIYINDAAIAAPQGGQELIWTRDGTKEFAGRIGTVNQVQTGTPNRLKYEVECIDYSIDLDMELINRGSAFPAQIAGDTVRTIVGIVGRGFTSNNVQDGPSIGKLDAEFAIPSALIAQIAEAIEYQFYVDYDRDVHFYFLGDEAAPIATINIDADVDTYYDAEWEEDWEQVKNRIYLTGAKAKSSNQTTESFSGDGAQTFYPLGYEPWDPDSIDVQLDTVSQTLLVDFVDGEAGDGGGSAGQAYVCYDNWGVRFPDGSPPGVGVDIDIPYNYAFEPVVVVEDPASIAAMKLRENTASAPSNGVHELHFQIPELRVDDINTIFDYGQLLLLRYASVVKTLSFGSRVQGWRAGQHFTATSSVRSISNVLYVTRVQKTVLRSSPVSEIEYAITASNIPFAG